MKKTILYLFTLVLTSVAFFACEDPYANQTIADPTIFEQPAMQDVNFVASVKTTPLTITASDLGKTLNFITVTSVPTLLDSLATVEYGVILSDATNFSKYKPIKVTKSGNNLIVDYTELNDTLKALNLAATEHDAYARVLAYIVNGGKKALYTTVSLPFKVKTNNYGPKANNDEAKYTDNGASILVLKNDTDPEGDVLTVVSVTTPENGTAAISNNGKEVTYTPNAGYSGTDSFTYTISDGHGNTSTATVTLVKAIFPENLYMIGQEFGGWNWGSDKIVEMTPVNGNPGKFWAVRYFENPSNGFKWCTVRAWSGDFFSLGTDVGFTTHDGNAFVSAAGFYIVLVDYTTQKITIEPAQVYGMGTTFGGWNTGQYPFVANGNVMKLTTTAAGEVRMYANSSAAGVGGDWWRMEFVILDGKIAYRGNGGDQTRVPVDAGKVVTLDFNNNTGTIQ